MGERIWDKAIKVLAALAGGAAGALGGWDPLLKVLIALMAADYASGVIVAVIVGVVVALNQRLREIEGGEEEEAKQY